MCDFKKMILAGVFVLPLLAEAGEVDGGNAPNGYQIECVRDERAMDGDLVRILIQGDKLTGMATATIERETESPVSSFKSKLTIREEKCQFLTGVHGSFQKLDCQGVSRLRVGQLFGRGVDSKYLVEESLYKTQESFLHQPVNLMNESPNGCNLKD